MKNSVRNSVLFAATLAIVSTTSNTVFGYNSYNFNNNGGFNEATATVVKYSSQNRPGTIIIQTEQKFLYYVLSDSKAIRYKVAVGRKSAEWSGKLKVSRKAEWPSWRAPIEMLKRDPSLPAFVKGGKESPLGARALYLGNTLYRIHGTPVPTSVGKAVTSGCIRLRNADIEDLYQRAKIGTPVVVTN